MRHKNIAGVGRVALVVSHVICVVSGWSVWGCQWVVSEWSVWGVSEWSVSGQCGGVSVGVSVSGQ